LCLHTHTHTHTHTHIYYIHRPRLSGLRAELSSKQHVFITAYTYTIYVHERKTRVTINRLPCRRRARLFTGHKSLVLYHNERCAFLLLLLFFLRRPSATVDTLLWLNARNAHLYSIIYCIDVSSSHNILYGCVLSMNAVVCSVT
jgi:hypothetical protein